MNPFQLVIVVSMLATLGIGIAVLAVPVRRSTHVAFGWLTAFVLAWLASMFTAALAHTREAAALWIRMSSVAGALAPVGVALMRAAIIRSNEPLRRVAPSLWPWFVVYLAVAVTCFTPYFLEGARLPPPGKYVAEPLYGPAFPVLGAYFLGAVVVLLRASVRDARRLTGILRTQIQFVLLGYGLGLLVATILFTAPYFFGNMEAGTLLPLASIMPAGFIAYGIATTRIFDIPDVLRRITAYGLLAVYLILIYLVIWLSASYLVTALRRWKDASSPPAKEVVHLAPSPGDPGQSAGAEPARTIPWGDVVPPLLATLVVVFSMAPMRGFMQRLANRLLISLPAVDLAETVDRASSLLRTIETSEALLQRFAEMMVRILGTNRVVILLRESDMFIPVHATNYDAPTGPIDGNDPVPTLMRARREPVVLDLLRRERETADLAAALIQMQAMDVAACCGVFGKEGLDGLVLLGHRISGRIYGAGEQRALDVLCTQLAAALENARLYTEVQDAAIYHNILVDSLVSGVVAVDARGVVTVFNREAQRITGLAAGAVIGRPLTSLPPSLAAALSHTRTHGRTLRDHDATLRCPDGEEKPVRIGSCLFHGHRGRTLGALLVFQDLTAIRKLEQVVRRSDRLASLGTLSAGMAHEIKNPLVALKTFAQLLPERYQDEDFRRTFSSLVGDEIKRIDSLVNQLLRFARPRKPQLAPVHLHAVIDSVSRLTAQAMRHKNITFRRDFAAASDVVLADQDLLTQAMLNLLLNAIDAIDAGGLIRVATCIHEETGGIRLSIIDSGQGIAAEDLPHIFDPFFTTKSAGTGLGLSVTHGIITDHGGVIDVESAPGQGTAFHIVFPPVREAAVA